METVSDPHEVPSTPRANGEVRSGPASGRLASLWSGIRFAVLVYLGSRVLLLVVALVEAGVRHHPLMNELSNWDGMWYRELANKGYPTHVTHIRSTLGFFPLYPLVIWTVARPLLALSSHSSIWAITWAGVLVSGVGGLVATILIQRLTSGWWGRPAGRRAVVLFCLFPGSVVFSMVYAEGIMIPLAAGCILALQSRRWLLAGVLAGLATATEPEAGVLIVVCAVSAALELRRRGWSAAGLRSVVAPALAVTGLAAVLGFLWAWAGSPLATMTVQHYGWRERTDPFALIRLVGRFAKEISFSHFDHPTINLNLPVGIVGAIVLIVLLVLLIRTWREV
jgi:Gpi18-like mannosyltransferase